MKVIILSTVLCLALFSVKAQKVDLITVDQLNHRLSLGNDTVYVVNLWATWCVPCVKELPDLERLQQSSLEGPLKVLLVSVDFKSKLDSGVKPFIKRMKLKSEIFLLNEKDQQTFIEKIDKSWSGAVPATLVVNTARKRRQFIPRALTYNELLKIYNSNK